MYRTIPQLIVDAAARTPDRVWLRTDDLELTFAEAAGAVGAIAARLRERGIGHGSLVMLTTRTTPPYLLTLLVVVLNITAARRSLRAARAEVRRRLQAQRSNP